MTVTRAGHGSVAADMWIGLVMLAALLLAFGWAFLFGTPVRDITTPPTTPPVTTEVGG